MPPDDTFPSEALERAEAIRSQLRVARLASNGTRITRARQANVTTADVLDAMALTAFLQAVAEGRLDDASSLLDAMPVDLASQVATVTEVASAMASASVRGRR